MELTVDLSPEVWDYIVKESVLRGVSPEELCRWYMGDLARSENLYPSGSRVPAPMPEHPVMDPEMVEKGMAAQLEFAEQFAKFHMAAAGALDCEECTQKLSCADVRRNKCSHCQAAVLSVADDG